MPLKAACPRGTAGFMLVEVLVAMLLASIAVLAVASTHAAALRLTRMSQHRAQAALLAADLAERLRVHAAGAADGAWLGAYALNQSWPVQQGEAMDGLAAACDGAAAACSSLQFAQADAAHWRGLLRRSLPSGAAWVQMDALTVVADVWVAWRDPLLLSLDEAAQPALECPSGLDVAMDAGIRCLHLRVKW